MSGRNSHQAKTVTPSSQPSAVRAHQFVAGMRNQASHAPCASQSAFVTAPQEEKACDATGWMTRSGMFVFFSPAKSVSSTAIGRSAASATGFSRRRSSRPIRRSPRSADVASSTANATRQTRRTAIWNTFSTLYLIISLRSPT